MLDMHSIALWAAAGAAGEVAGGPVVAVAGAKGSQAMTGGVAAVLDGYGFGRTWKYYLQCERSRGDVALAIVAFVPYGGSTFVFGVHAAAVTASAAGLSAYATEQ
jgi:hypothetical protein